MRSKKEEDTDLIEYFTHIRCPQTGFIYYYIIKWCSQSRKSYLTIQLLLCAQAVSCGFGNCWYVYGSKSLLKAIHRKKIGYVQKAEKYSGVLVSCTKLL